MPPAPALTSQSGKLPLSITQPSHPPNQISNNLNCWQELLLFYPKVDKLQLTSPSALSHPLRSMAVANVAFTPLSQRKKLFQLTAPPPLPHRPVKLMLISPSALPLREVTLIPLLPLPLRVWTLLSISFLPHPLWKINCYWNSPSPPSPSEPTDCKLDCFRYSWLWGWSEARRESGLDCMLLGSGGM